MSQQNENQILCNIDSEGIKRVLPHREPFLWIDSIERCEIGKSCIAYKHLTGEEDFFRGHFPGMPVMPGVLQLEALAQCGAFAALSMDSLKGRIALFAKAENVRFRKQVVPGDVLRLEMQITRISRVGGKGRGVASVGGEVTCEGELTFVFAKE